MSNCNTISHQRSLSRMAYCSLGIFLLIIFISNYTIARSVEEVDTPDKSIDWDVIVFTQQWPVTTCIDHKEKKKGGTCNLFKNMTSWTVHGLWPTKLGTRGPTFCNTTWPFDESKVHDLEPFMFKYWANIFADSNKLDLWKHEWSKHGTCAAQLDQLNDEHKYFSQGLKWVVQHDIRDGLALYGITPNNTKPYSSEQLFAALRDFFRVEPVVDCVYDKEASTNLLWQIKLCFDRSLQLVSCVKGRSEVHLAPHNRGNCPEQGIYYPEDVGSRAPTTSILLTDSDSVAPITSNSLYHTDRQLRQDRRPCVTPLCRWLFSINALNIAPF